MSTARWRRIFALITAVVLLASVSGCSDADDTNPSGVSGFNYTSYYIARFDVTNEDQNLGAGGGNIFPKDANEERSESGEMCCISIPSHWRPGMKLVVSWIVDKVMDGKYMGAAYTATTEVPPYGPHTWGFWVHFLPGDRIRVQIQDKPDIPNKPDEHDPYIVQGVPDPQHNPEPH
jgi:hypothetical protein